MQPETLPCFEMNSPTLSKGTGETISLLIWLIGGLAAAAVYAWMSLSGAHPFGLGWAVRPGWALLTLGTTCLGVVLVLRRAGLPSVLGWWLCFLAAITLEYLPLPRPADSFARLVLTLLGQTVFFRGAFRVGIPEILLLLLVSYVQAVSIYDMFRGEQMMFFFKPGWTL